MGSWADFFAERRLGAVLQSCEKNNGKNAELRGLVEKMTDVVVPRLLGDGHLGGKEGMSLYLLNGFIHE